MKETRQKALTLKCQSSLPKQVCNLTTEMNQKANLLFMQKEKRACKYFASQGSQTSALD